MQSTHSLTVQARIKKNASEFGNKAANLIELDTLCKNIESKILKIQISPIQDALLKKHLDTAKTARLIPDENKKSSLFLNEYREFLKNNSQASKTLLNFFDKPTSLTQIEKKNNAQKNIEIKGM